MSDKLFSTEAISAMLDNDEKEIKELAVMFVEFVPAMMRDLQNAIDSQDWPEAGKQAHKLKSTLKIWQIESLLDAILFIEMKGKVEEDTEEIKQQNQKVQEVLLRVIEQVKEEFNL